jgi:hypothetical protein
MEKVTFVFEIDGLRKEEIRTYSKKPTREQIEKDMKEWFFGSYYMWFAVEQNEKEINLEDF